MLLKFLREEQSNKTVIKYKNLYIEHYPIVWHFEESNPITVDGWIIRSPYKLTGDYYLPLYCEDGVGNVINFKTLDACKQYIDDYIEPKKGKMIWKYGDECHFELYKQIAETFEVHDQLNPQLWEADGNLKVEVKNKVIEIAEEFVKQIETDGVNLKVVDIWLLGSNANYNYTEESDLDVHLIADESFDCSEKHLDIIYNAYKSLFNKKYNITIKGINVELYVENKDALTNVSTGVYSLKDGWLKKPARLEIPEINSFELDKRVNEWENRYFELTQNPTVDKVDACIDDLYEIRRKSIYTEGEFGLGNLVFKEIRRRGYLENLRELKNSLISKNLSLESLN